MVATSRGLLQPGPDHVRRLGRRPGLESIKRRTREGLERARQQGKTLGQPRKFNQEQLEAVRRMRKAGASLRRIAEAFECSPNTVRRALRRKA